MTKFTRIVALIWSIGYSLALWKAAPIIWASEPFLCVTVCFGMLFSIAVLACIAMGDGEPS